MYDSLRPHGLYSPWNSLGQNTGVGSLFLPQGIFPTQGWNPGLPQCRQILYQLSHQGSPRILEWVAYPFSQPRNQTRVFSIAGGFFTSWAIKEALNRMAWYKFPLSSSPFTWGLRYIFCKKLLFCGLKTVITYVIVNTVFQISTVYRLGFPRGTSGKEPTTNSEVKRHGFESWVEKIPWRRKWEPTLVFLPGKSHGQRSLAGYCPWGRKESDMTEAT